MSNYFRISVFFLTGILGLVLFFLVKDGMPATPFSMVSNQQSPLFITVDFEQGFYDARTSDVAVNPGAWMSSYIEDICYKRQCIILQSSSVLGGDVIDVNSLYREAFSIESPAEKPDLGTNDILNFIEILEGKRN
ncbi:MAG: hypothetical protein IBX55_01845 [Methyloprofundus sp.]|nr:hypothetical protein [Methyloprofundus sp.]